MKLRQLIRLQQRSWLKTSLAPHLKMMMKMLK